MNIWALRIRHTPSCLVYVQLMEVALLAAGKECILEKILLISVRLQMQMERLLYQNESV